ncbi:MAG TPA: Ig-like domain-containing protein [Candidatus Dormibacteraeota bacterium]|nr:Ig-like domain-containing protein [Candidatus Dormibacteraeota bacterium]
MSTGLGDAGPLVLDSITYTMNTNFHPRVWSANAVLIYQWWLQRSNAQISVNYSTNGYQCVANLAVSGSLNPNTAVELVVPGTNSFCSLQVVTNGVLASGNAYRVNGQIIKVLVGASVTNVSIGYFPFATGSPLLSQNFDGVTAPALPSGWSTSSSGAQSNWTTQTGTNDTGPNVAFCPDGANVGLTELVTPFIAVPVGLGQLTFRTFYDFEVNSTVPTDGYDGGVLELKLGTNGTFTDIVSAGGTFLTGGYNCVINTNFGNPLAGRAAWSGNSGGFITTLVNLPNSTSGQNIQLRWRCGTDNANGRTGWRIDSVGVTSRGCLCCNGTNTAPVLQAQANQTIAELTALTVTNSALDAETNTLAYSLINPPAGANIDPNGVITWTPAEAQGPGNYTITTVVTDNGFPPLSATNNFTVAVLEVNSAPALPNQSNRTVAELAQMTVVNTASDTDLPANTLTYSLVNPPAGASINSSGVITWVPTEAQGPGTYTITTTVTDNGVPPLSATNHFDVTVTEVNSAPVFLATPPNQTIAAGAFLTVTNAASDSDIPSNALSYSLASGPGNASISSAGVITWTPSAGQNHTTNLFRTVVTDNGSPPLSATNVFTIIVNGDPALILDSTTLALEGCAPTNNAIDPGENVTVLFALRNTGLGNTTNLVVSLLATNGVAVPSGPQAYGALVAGGSAVSMPFSFAGVGTCGSNITVTLQLQDGAADLGTITASMPLGQISLILTQNFDSVTAPALPAGWTTTSSGAESNWVTQAGTNNTPPNVVFSPDAANTGVNELLSPAFVLSAGPSQLAFRHFYDLEQHDANEGYDGGVLEVKIGTNPFADILVAGGSFVTNGYTRTISSLYSNALGGRLAWSGTSPGFIPTIVNLPASAAGQTIQLRWRCGADNGVGLSGWRIDSVAVTGFACCGNTPPLLGAQSDKTVNELANLSITNTATDSSAPPGSLTYSLLNPPAGALIDNNGVITWSPTEAQGPGSYSLTTIVTDHAFPPLSATNSFNVTVNELNSAPQLTAQPDRTLVGTSALSVTNSATDPDLPANSLSYSLLNPPLGAVIDSNGIITWTPSPAQVPSTNVLTTVATDTNPSALNSQHLSVTNSFNVVVLAIHNGPSLSPQLDQTLNELSLLSVTNAATSGDIPPLAFSYQLLNPPSGAAIDANGQITWTPTEAQGPSTNLITTIVTDTGSPPLSATNSFFVVVNEVNTAPILPVQTDRTTVGLSSLVITNTATDSDLPANPLFYSLQTGPTNATIDADGIITWTPVASQVPSTNVFTTVVTDSNIWAINAQQLTATNIFTVTVSAIHNGPSLAAQTNLTVDELTLLVVTNTATDSDVPSLSLGYALLNPPDGATIDTNGVISWTPSEAQGPGTYTLATVAADNGQPSVSVTNTFDVHVNEVNCAPVLPGQTNVTFSGGGTLFVTNTASDPDLPSNTLSYVLLSAPPGVTITSNGIISIPPGNGIATLTTSSNMITTVVTDGGQPSMSATNSFVVYLTGTSTSSPPQILYVGYESGVATITWSSTVGRKYILESKDDLAGFTWAQHLPSITATNTITTFTDTVGDLPQRFYRISLLP